MSGSAPVVRRPLFRRYVGLFVAVVSFALIANGGIELWFSFQDHRLSLIRIQREQAAAAAAVSTKTRQRAVETDVTEQVREATGSACSPPARRSCDAYAPLYASMQRTAVFEGRSSTRPRPRRC